MDVKENLAKNLINYRKMLNLTQADLAEKINYSDKAVSKWERGDAVPELNVLKQLADFYGVKVDTLLSEPKKLVKPRKNITKKRAIISLSCAVFVWLIAISCFSFIGIIIPSLTKTWFAFIYAVPVTLFILLMLTSVWGKSLGNVIIFSLLTWTTLTAIFLSFTCIPETPIKNIWEIYLIGIPLQILVIVWYFYKKVK